MRHTGPIAPLIALALLTGCTSPGLASPTASPKTSTLTEELTRLRDEGASLGTMVVNSDRALAWVVRGGTTEFLSLLPTRDEPEERPDSRQAIVGWDVADPAAIDAQVKTMSMTCPEIFTVDIDAVTATAYIATVACHSRFKPVKSYLNQTPLPVISTQWTLQDWQHLVDEWNALSPSRRFLGIRIDHERVIIHLNPDDGTHTCQTPAVSRTLDSKKMFHNCLTEYGGETFSFAGLTAEMITAAISRAETELNAKVDATTEYSFYAAEGGGIEFRITIGDHQNRQILKP